MLSRQELRVLLDPQFILTHVLATHRYILSWIKRNPSTAFDPCRVRGKRMVMADLLAEKAFQEALEKKFGTEKLWVLGEESLATNPDLRGSNKTCVLVDMVDGTDLLRRDFSNWCSAIVVFSPKLAQIEGAFVGMRSGFSNNLYFTTQTRPPSRLHMGDERATKVNALRPRRATRLPKLPSDVSLDNAAVCMYGQKSFALKRLLGLQSKTFQKWLTANEAKDRKLRDDGSEDEIGFRFYNLAGNPMMVRMCEGTVDLVFDLGGQYPHDVVPGALIALRAGAVMQTPDGAPITERELIESLYKPNGTKLQYILGGNAAMLDEFRGLLRESQAAADAAQAAADVAQAAADVTSGQNDSGPSI